MGFFNKKKNSFVAIKLYCLGEPEDREALVTAILQVVQSAFGEPPADYDINGPYGVKKGSTIGLSAFKGLLVEFRPKLTQGFHPKLTRVKGAQYT